MIEYKNSFDPSNLNLSKFKEKTFQSELEDISDIKNNVEIFFENFDQNLSYLQNSNHDITQFHQVFNFIIRLGRIFQYEDVIPAVVQSGMFNIIINSLDHSAEDVFLILDNMMYCSFENLLLLLKNDLILTLFNGLKNPDEDICRLSIRCFSTIISHENENIEKQIFIFSLIISTNFIPLLYDRLHHDINDGVICSFLYFLDLFYRLVPFKSNRNDLNLESFANLFDDFTNECLNPDLFQKSIFMDILQNSISLSSFSIYYRILHQSLVFAANTTQVSIIVRFCYVIFELLHRDISLYGIIFNVLNFSVYIDNWLKLKQKDIFYILSFIISQLFYESLDIIHLADDVIEKLSSASLYIFDISSKLNDEEFESAAIAALTNAISFTGCLPPNLLNDKRKERIISQLINSNYRLSCNYSFLVLCIASYSNDFNQILNFDVMEKIFGNMYRLDGNLVEFALFYFEVIFRKQKNENKKDFRNLFINSGGDDILQEMMDSDIQKISDQATNIFDHYINLNYNKFCIK